MERVIVFDVDGVILQNGQPVDNTLDFIKNNYKKYIFFTNTTFPKVRLKKIFQDLNLGKYFMELLAYEDGTKKENIKYITEVYDTKSEDILFIDDNITHIDAVESTGVHTLLFEQDGVPLEEKVNNIFK